MLELISPQIGEEVKLLSFEEIMRNTDGTADIMTSRMYNKIKDKQLIVERVQRSNNDENILVLDIGMGFYVYYPSEVIRILDSLEVELV